MNEHDALQAVRQRIDEVDNQIQTLLNKRAELAEQVAQIKSTMGDANQDFYRPDREALILRQVIERNQGPLEDKEVARLFREIMSACLAAEKPLLVAYLGPEGSFTETAALKQFGGSVKLEGKAAITDVFHAVETGHADYGVVPVENSSEGIVSHTLDRFITSPLKINGEVSLRIHHNLLSTVLALDEITHIYAHPQALAQCKHWLSEQAAHCQLIPVASNSEAAKYVASHVKTAAIAGDRAAEIYGLSVLAQNIEDEADNTTRFLVIGDQDVGPSGQDKTALLVSTKNQPGALQMLLKPLADHGISMTRIESRPSRQGIWEYVFFIDIEGHHQDETVASALQELEQQAAMLRILGSYPKAVL